MKARLSKSVVNVFVSIVSVGAVLAQTERVVYVTVEGSKKGFVQGLPVESFRLADDGQATTITGFSSSPEPVSIGFVFDVSGSMLQLGERDLSDAAASIYTLVKSNEQKGEYFLTGLNRGSHRLTDWTTDAERIGDGLKRLPSVQSRRNNNTTSLHLGFLEALAKVGEGRFRKKALILFSDGRDSSDDSRLGEVVRMVQKSDVLIYVITISEPAPLLYTIGPHQSTEFVDITTSHSGGRLFSAPSTLPENRARVFVRNANTRIRSSFESVFRDLASQYALRFTAPTPAKADGVRAVNVKVSIPTHVKKDVGSISVRFRKKYRV